MLHSPNQEDELEQKQAQNSVVPPHWRGGTTEYIIYGNKMFKAGVYFIKGNASHCEKWE